MNKDLIRMIKKIIWEILEKREEPIKRMNLWKAVFYTIKSGYGGWYIGLNLEEKTILGNTFHFASLANDDRSLRRIFTQLKKEKPVGSSLDGYFRIRSQKDFEKSVSMKISKIRGLNESIKAEKEKYETMLGIQLNLPMRQRK